MSISFSLKLWKLLLFIFFGYLLSFFVSCTRTRCKSKEPDFVVKEIKLFGELYSEQKPFVIVLEKVHHSDTLVYNITFKKELLKNDSVVNFFYVNEVLVVLKDATALSCTKCTEVIAKKVSKALDKNINVYRSSGVILHVYQQRIIRRLCWHKSTPESAAPCE